MCFLSKKSMRNEIYLDIINEGVTKILSFQDIKANSITEGCFFILIGD